MSTVDIAAIEEAMKMAALDQHRGYAKESYGEIKQDRDTEYMAKTQAAGYQIIREPLWNKGMSSPSLTTSGTVPGVGGMPSRYLVWLNICAISMLLRRTVKSRARRLFSYQMSSY